MKKNNWLYSVRVVTTIFALALSPLTKAVVLYDEALSGDSTGGELFSLTDGSNTFLGSQPWSDAVDGFRFVVADGHQATVSITYSFSGVPAEDGGFVYIWDLVQFPPGTGSCSATSWEYDCVAGIPGDTTITGLALQSKPGVLTNPDLGWPALNTIVLGPGIYGFFDNYRFVTPPTTYAGQMDYSINVEQTAVPLPSTAWLFLTGLVSFVSIRKSRKERHT